MSAIILFICILGKAHSESLSNIKYFNANAMMAKGNIHKLVPYGFKILGLTRKVRKNKAPFSSTLHDSLIDSFSKNLKQVKKKTLGAPPFRNIRAKVFHFLLIKTDFY